VDEASKWGVLEDELEHSVLQGGGMFCGQHAEGYAINGVTYQWPRGSHLRWGIGFSRLGGLSDMDCKDATLAALKEIADCCDVTHDYVSNINAGVNIRLIARRLDGASGVLAQMGIPVGNVTPDTMLLGEFDDAENYVLAENPAPGTIDFYRVVLHELLHAHGLGHKPASIQRPALIAPVYSPTMRHLQDADKDELLRRYGHPKPLPVPPPVVPVPGAKPIYVTNIVEQDGKKWQAKSKLTRVT
jgi:hypothetical protein